MIRQASKATTSLILIPVYRSKRTIARIRCAFCRPLEALCSIYKSTAARIRFTSSSVNGIVGLWTYFGAFRSFAGFSPIHFRLWANLKNARRRSNFFAAVCGPSFHWHRNSSNTSIPNWSKRDKWWCLENSVKCLKSNRYFRTVLAFSFRASRSATNRTHASSAAILSGCLEPVPFGTGSKSRTVWRAASRSRVPSALCTRTPFKRPSTQSGQPHRLCFRPSVRCEQLFSCLR